MKVTISIDFHFHSYLHFQFISKLYSSLPFSTIFSFLFLFVSSLSSSFLLVTVETLIPHWFPDLKDVKLKAIHQLDFATSGKLR
jgi:hypothetical protein